MKIAISLKVCMLKKKKIYSACVLKHNSNREKQVILASSCSKKISALLRGTTSKHYGVFYCLDCLHSIRTKNKLQSQKRVCENKDFGNIIMPSEESKILEFNQHQKTDKAPFVFVIYADL